MTTILSRRGVRPKHYWTGGEHIERFCVDREIHAVINPCHENPWTNAQFPDALNWSVTLVRCAGTIPPDIEYGKTVLSHGKPIPTFGTFFSTGDVRVPVTLLGDAVIAIPTPGLVLSSVLSDAYSMEPYDGPTPWRDWADALGMDPNGTDAMMIWDTMATQVRKLKTFLGDDYEDAMGAFKLDEGFVDWDDEPTHEDD